MHNFLTKLFAFLASLFLRFTCSLNKLSVSGQDIFERYTEESNNIFAFWHGRLFYLTYYNIKNVKKRTLSILISMSRDGDYGVALANKLGQNVVRGSRSRGGHQAIRTLAAQISAGNNIVMTPDGPRGPAFRVNEGVIRVAQLTRSRIIPVSYQATRRKELKSWDRFIIVKPFGKVHVAFGEPIEVPRDSSPEEVERYRKELEEALLELDRVCAEKLGLKTM